VRIQGINPLMRLLRLWIFLRGGKWQIVHAHTLFGSGLFLLVAMLAGVPRRVVHAHSTNDTNRGNAIGRVYQYSMRWLLSWVPTDYVACGSAAASYLFPGRRDVKMIPNAIDIDRFALAADASYRHSLNLAPDTVLILQVGRLIPVKNHTLSLKIAAALRNKGLDFQMLFVGIGPEQHNVESVIEQYDLKAWVRMLGLREDISELMAAADVMLMPSLYEGFPVVLVESQAAGLPAVISSTISEEVDLNLGLVSFISLDASLEMWTSSIMAAVRAEPVAVEARRSVLEARGFSAGAGAAYLTSIYTAS